MVYGLLDYSHRDPQDALSAFKQKLTQFSNGNWTDFTPNDVGYALAQTMLEIADMNALFCDANLTESFLSLAQLRESVVRLSKMLNYVPGLIQAAKVSVQLTFNSFGGELDIAANSQWSINNLPFTCLEPIAVPAGQTTTTVDMYQGTPFSLTVPGTNGPWQSITVPNTLAKFTTYVNNVAWTAVDSFIGVQSPQSYKVYEDAGATLTFRFGSNQSTYAPGLSDTILVQGVLTSGQAGNFSNTGYSVRPLSVIRFNGTDVSSQITGTTLTSSQNGANPESVDSIRANAPAFYSTGGRCVTEDDYKAFLFANIPGLGDCQVVGGEKLGMYGSIVITAYPQNNPGNVSLDFLNSIVTACDAVKVVGMRVKAQAPVQFRIDLSFSIGVNPTIYDTLGAPQTLAASAVSTLIGGLTLGSNLYLGKIVAAIENIPGITYANPAMTVTTQKQIATGSAAFAVPVGIVATNVTILNAAGTVLFQGDATSMITNNVLTYINTNVSDQLCSCIYRVTAGNVFCSSGQMAVLDVFNITAAFDSGTGV